MTTRLDLLNKILRALGEPRTPTATITASSPQAVKSAEAEIDAAAKLVAESHPWNFLTVVEQLAGDGEDEPLGWGYQFNKPATCLRIVKVTVDGGWDTAPIGFEDRAGAILTNSETSYLHHVSQTRLDLMGSWPEHFASAVALEAAWWAGPSAELSAAKLEAIERNRAKTLSAAKTHDGQQASAKPRYPGAFVRAASSGWASREND